MFSKSFPRKDWFKHLFGFQESLENVKKYISIQENSENTKLISSMNNQKFNSGHFSLFSANSFDKTTLNKKPGNKNGKLNIVHGQRMKSKMLEYVDIMNGCSFPEFKGATFQVASNFNCLEFANDKQTAFDGITIYSDDLTQGPEAAISCAASTLYRNYFIKHEESDERGQLSTNINLLKNTPLNVHNGKVKIISEDEIQRLKSLNFDWKNISNYYVGSHENCQVCISRGKKHSQYKIHESLINNLIDTQLIHQVFASAFNFTQNVIPNQFTFEISQHLLFSEYYNTILIAWRNAIKYSNYPGSNKCFLTLLGGGVFSNPPHIIAPAISRCEDIISESGLDVYVVCFDDESFGSFIPLLENTMRRTGGNVIIT